MRTIVRLAFFLATAVTITLALLPDLRLPPLIPWGKHSDIVYHLGAFFVLTAMGILATRKIVPPISCMVIFASLLECLQILVPGRQFSLSDLAASVAGVLIGALLVTLVTTAGRRPLWPVRLV